MKSLFNLAKQSNCEVTVFNFQTIFIKKLSFCCINFFHSGIDLNLNLFILNSKLFLSQGILQIIVHAETINIVPQGTLLYASVTSACFDLKRKHLKNVL